jgi:predicted MPP superfamily phosphohydrolase
MTTPALLKPYITPKKTLKFRPDGSFKICCFSDLHQTANYHPSTLAAMHGIIEREQPDLVLLGGDLWNENPEATVEQLREFLDIFSAPMEQRHIPWAHVYGNHDHDILMDRRLVQSVFESYPHCVSGHTEEGVDGVSNFLLPIRSSDEKRIAFAVWGLDTHNLSDGQKLRNGVNLREAHQAKDIPYGTSHWDFVRFNQLRWYYDTSEALEAYNGSPVDALMLMHAPILEFGICMKDPARTSLVGDMPEALFSGSLNSGLLATVLQRGDVRAIVSGHMHEDNFAADYCGVKLCFDGAIGFRGTEADISRCARIFTLCESDTARMDTHIVFAKDVL